MPVMDGIAATRRIRASGMPYAEVPIVAVTAYAMAGDREYFLTEGMDGYLGKPIEFGTLEQVIGEIVGNKGG